MRTGYIKYKFSRMKAYLVREKTDFKKELRNLEFAQLLSWTFAVMTLFLGCYMIYVKQDSSNYFIGGFLLVGIYSMISIWKDYKRGDDVAHERAEVKKRLYKG